MREDLHENLVVDQTADEQENQWVPIDALPDEILAHILNFCDIRQVCLSMSVSKKWQAAARYAIRMRKTIILCQD